MHFAEDMVCVGGLMAGEYRVGVGVSEARQVRRSYKDQNSIIFNCPLLLPFFLKKQKNCVQTFTFYLITV